jgi:hypothetical protein
MNERSPTSVWEGEDEPSAKDIISRFIFFFSDKGGDPEVSLVLESSFDAKGYSYSLKNTSKETVRVSWQTDGTVDLFQKLQKEIPSLSTSVAVEIGKRSESTIAEQIKQGRTIEPGQTIPFRVVSTAAPKAISTNLDIGSLDGRPLAGAILFILVPGH